jgi:hypothetical protein
MSKPSVLVLKPLRPIRGLYMTASVGANAEDGAVRLAAAIGPLQGNVVISTDQARLAANMILAAVEAAENPA